MTMIETIRISRRAGRLNKAECFDKHGGKIGELPLVGIEQHEYIADHPVTKLTLHSARVVLENRQ